MIEELVPFLEVGIRDPGASRLAASLKRKKMEANSRQVGRMGVTRELGVVVGPIWANLGQFPAHPDSEPSSNLRTAILTRSPATQTNIPTPPGLSTCCHRGASSTWCR
jgi:hypothetical protein